LLQSVPEQKLRGFITEAG